MRRTGLRPYLILAGCLLILTAIYLPTLLTRVSGGRDATGEISPYMDDVGEIQVSLNVWGTVHHTGYPLFTILGNLCVAGLRAVGVDPAPAPAIYALLWSLIGLAIFYLLLFNLTAKAVIAAACTVLLGLTRTIWIHGVIAEVYSMALTISILLLALALWRGEMTTRRLYWLALIGGIGAAHHRLILFLAPGLVFAVLPLLHSLGRRAIRVLMVALLLGLVGFLPYLYLPLRAQAGAIWVYGNPSTFTGFWHEFTGAEAAYLMQPSPSLLEDLLDTLNILATELDPALALSCGLACFYVLSQARHRRHMLIALLGVAAPFLYLIVQHRVVMPQAVAMPLVMVLLLGLGLALDSPPLFPLTERREIGIISAVTIFLCIVLIGAHRSVILGLTQDPTGERMIAAARRVPRDGGHGVLMLPWGPNYTAVAYSKYVTGENADLPLVKHTADFPALAQQNAELYTFKDVFYRFGLPFWDAQFGRVYLSVAAEDVIAIKRAPLTAETTPDEIPISASDGISLRSLGGCTAMDSETESETIHLTLLWHAESQPSRDLSVSVHMLSVDSDVPLLAADSAAPVYGWYPTSRWSAGEVIYDLYTLPRLPTAARIAVGMYTQVDGQFQNYGRTVLSLAQMPVCPDLKAIR